MGCSDEKSTDDAQAVEALDITGKYQIFPGSATGSTLGEGEDAISENFWVIDWMTGPLKVNDGDEGLSFLFPKGGEEGYEFSASIIDNGTFTLFGDVVFEGSTDRGLGPEPVMARLSLDGSGEANMNEDCWKLTGHLLVTVDEDDDGIEVNNCEINVPFEASQLSGGSCKGMH